MPPRLCARTLSSLTLDGAARDGVGILRRLEDDIRERAHKIWLETGNDDAVANWKAAEKEILVLVDEAEKGLAGDLAGNPAIEYPEACPKYIHEPEQLLKIREAEVKQLREELQSLFQQQEEEAVQRQKQAERVKELECTLDARSASIAEMEEAYRDKLKQKNEKESALQEALEDCVKKVKLITKDLDNKNDEIKDTKLQLQRLADENSIQRKEIARLKLQIKEVCEEGERNRENPQDGGSKLLKAKESLPEKEKASMNAILQRHLVEVDYCNDSFKISNSIQFRGIQHGSVSNDLFINKEKTAPVLEDMARLLQIFQTAKVLIVGHTATTENKLDSWSHTLALNRAKVVMQQLEVCGVDKSRLDTAVLPGNRHSGAHQVVIKVVEL